MKKWVNAYAPLYSVTNVKLTTVSKGAVVISHEIVDDFSGIPREAVSYVAPDREYHGYVYTGYLEPYVESLRKSLVLIRSATPTTTDADQYAIINGVKQTELCGEICAAFLLGLTYLEDLLDEWQREALPFYQRVFDVFKTRKAKGTGPADLMSMLAVFDRKSRLLSEALYDPILERSRYTVSGLAALAGRVIVSVHIDNQTGRLKPSGVLHWVVVTEVMPERTGYGFIKIFNPFPGREEIYSWSEFIASGRSPYGVVLDE